MTLEIRLQPIINYGNIFEKKKQNEIEIKDNCQAISAPEHGDVRCSRSRHTSQWFYQTKCSFWCNEGYTLMGPSVKYCNGTDGIWDLSETTCVRKLKSHFNTFPIN